MALFEYEITHKIRKNFDSTPSEVKRTEVAENHLDARLQAYTHHRQQGYRYVDVGAEVKFIRKVDRP